MAASIAAIPAPPEPRLSAFKIISFDMFDTLVDWESGTYDALLASYLQLSEDAQDHLPLPEREEVLRMYANLIKSVQHEHPLLPYVGVLEQAHYRLMAQALKLGDTSVASSNDFANLVIGDWPSHPDTKASLQRLSDLGYKIVLFSNLEPEVVKKALSGPLEKIKYDGVYAMDAGTHLILNVKEFDKVVAQSRSDFPDTTQHMLHVARGMKWELTSSKQIGVVSIRGEKSVDAIAMEMIKDKGGVCWRFDDLKALADACENDWRTP